MLGKLAKWLKIAGHDVIYQKESNRAGLLKIAQKENRIILTRDTHISYDNMLFVESEMLWEQVEQVFRNYRAPHEKRKFSRCILCNEELVIIEKKNVKGKVPPYVFKAHDNFLLCPSCGRIYWEGSHYKNMIKMLDKILVSINRGDRRDENRRETQ